MTELRCTLISDGSSDAALLPILRWLLVTNGLQTAVQAEWADLRLLPEPPQTLAEKITRGCDLFPCDLLFVHRDAERETRETRLAEIHKEVDKAFFDQQIPYICVIPIRMTEAWLLFDEGAIRQAAGNRSDTIQLNLPPLQTVESLLNPKQILHDILREASGLKGRRLNKFPVNKRVHRISELARDFSPLRQLTAFTALEADIQQFIGEWSSALSR